MFPLMTSTVSLRNHVTPPTPPPKQVGGDKRTLLRFHPRMAPIKVAVFPLVKNKPELMEKARGIYETIRLRHNAFWDVSGAIGEIREKRQMGVCSMPRQQSGLTV